MYISKIRNSFLSISISTALVACGGGTPLAPTEVALNKISAYAESKNNTVPTLQDYQDAGIQGVTVSNLSRVNQAIDALEKEDVDSVVELQSIISEIKPEEPSAEIIKIIVLPSVSNIGKNSATIVWSLNHAGTGQVEYGKSRNYGLLSQKENSFRYDSHAQVLKSLQTGTTYHYRVISEDENGKRVVSEDKIFNTLEEKSHETPDTTKPTIILRGSSKINLTVGDSYTEAGATASDNKDGNISAKIIKTGSVNTTTVGTYTIKYNVSDEAGNKASQVVRTVTVKAKPPTPDTTKPTITLQGSSKINLTVGDSYTEAGATASDNKDGNISAKIIKTGSVNTATVGTYTIKYNVSDEAGNKASQVVRTVIVKAKPPTPDTTKPTITLQGSSKINLTVGDSYTEAGATASDNKDGNISAKIIKTGSVNTTTVGTYTIKYNVSDEAGNKASQVVRTVIVKAKPPTIEALEITTYPSVGAIDETQATVSWSLNHKATGQIEFGTTSGYGLFSQKETSFKYDSHSQRLKNLQSGTTYHYRVISEDANGKKVNSGDNTFKTTAVDNGTFPVGTNVPIWIIGDSTVVSGGSRTPPRGGWGEFISSLVKNGSRVKNKAIGGSTAKSFFNQYWSKVKQDITGTDTSKGAYLFIEFGHNDRDSTQDGNINKATVPGLGNEYDDYLMRYIDFARSNNVIPVLVTGTASMCNHNCGSRTYIRINSLPSNTPSPWKDMIGKVGDWPKTKREIGAREDVTVLDLTSESVEHFASFDSTQEVRDQYAWKPQTNDDTHFNKAGAKKMAELVKDLACDLDNGGDAMLCSQFKEGGTKNNAIFPAETAMKPIATKSVKKLAVGESVIGPAFGGTITRVTGTGVRASGSKHPYAKTQAWNSDMSMIRLSFRLYDAETLKELPFTKGLAREAAYKKTSNGLSEIKWSSTNPNIFYGIKVRESQFWKGTINRGNNTIAFKMLHDFGSYKDFRLGPYEGNIDYNDKYVAFYAKKSGASYPTGIVYDIPNDRVVATKDLTDIKKIDWLSVDPKGKYVVLRDSASSGYKVYRYNLDLTNKKILASTAAHGDLGLDQNGDSIYVQWGFSGSGNNGVWMYRLKDFVKTKLMPINYGSGHVSCRNKDRKGWCYLSTQTEKYREVFAVKLSYNGPDSPVVNRFAQTHESGTRSSVATVSPDGSRVIFMSDWGTPVGDYYDRSTYHVEFK